MTKEDLDAFIEREADKYAISEFCEKESPVQHENSKIDFKEGSNLLAPLLLQACEALKFYANPKNFESGKIDTNDMYLAMKIVGRFIDVNPPRKEDVWVGGKKAFEALTQIKASVKGKK